MDNNEEGGQGVNTRRIRLSTEKLVNTTVVFIPAVTLYKFQSSSYPKQNDKVATEQLKKLHIDLFSPKITCSKKEIT